MISFVLLLIPLGIVLMLKKRLHQIANNRVYGLLVVVCSLFFAASNAFHLVEKGTFYPEAEGVAVGGVIYGLGAMLFAYPIGRSNKGEKTPAYYITAFVALTLALAHVLCLKSSPSYADRVLDFYASLGLKSEAHPKVAGRGD